tara:strand:- start:67 stop:453 length:387 start_codon:yes stop_codon:yes gene_type:complete
MAWKRKIARRYPKRNFTKIKNYNISRKLKNEGKINTEFEVMLSMLPLEDIIALKLDLANKSAGGHLYGLPLWKNLIIIVKEAVLKHAYSACYSKGDVAKYLDMKMVDLLRNTKMYKVEEFYAEKEENS